ncbi:hypothetical protein ACFLSE_00520 [Bacteroidota bacterium]
MEELEVKTYNFAVEGIGLVKSLEKEFPELAKSELKQSMGAVSLKFIDALNASENEDFANNLRECFLNAKKSSELLNTLGELSNETLNKQKSKLIKDSNLIIEKLDAIINRLIY